MCQSNLSQVTPIEVAIDLPCLEMSFLTCLVSMFVSLPVAWASVPSKGTVNSQLLCFYLCHTIKIQCFHLVVFFFLCKIVDFDFWEYKEAAVAAKSFQSCLTLCDPIDGSPPIYLYLLMHYYYSRLLTANNWQLLKLAPAEGKRRNSDSPQDRKDIKNLGGILSTSLMYIPLWKLALPTLKYTWENMNVPCSWVKLDFSTYTGSIHCFLVSSQFSRQGKRLPQSHHGVKHSLSQGVENRCGYWKSNL